MSETEEFYVHGRVERGLSEKVEAASAEEAQERAIERVKDDLREQGIPLDMFRFQIDEVVR